VKLPWFMRRRRRSAAPASGTMTLMEAKCPKCGSLDVDLDYSPNPLRDGCKCWDCGTVYPLNIANGVAVMTASTLDS
jgi:hypothetical protein